MEEDRAENERQFAPYAPASTVLTVVRHFRNRDVPERLTPTNLVQIGVSENLVGRVLRALQFLGLVDAGFGTTREFRAIPSATDEQYQEILGGLIRNAYADIFRLVDVANAPTEVLNNAFRPYSPAGQRERMVILFNELCREAGMRVSGTEEEPKITAPRMRLQPKRDIRQDRGPARPARTPSQGVNPTISALLEQLPQVGETWTRDSRDRWVRALEGILDLLYPAANGHDAEIQKE